MFETLAEFLLLAPLALGALLLFDGPGVLFDADGADGGGEGGSDAGDTGAQSRNDPAIPARGDNDATARDSTESRAASDAKKYRTERNDARRATDALSQKYDALAKSIRDLSGDNGDDGSDPEADAKATVYGAQMAIVESRFEVEAMRAGFDEDKVSMLFAHAEKQGVFSGIEVNVTRRTVEGMAEIVAEMKTEHADMLTTSKKPAPPASDTSSGKDTGFSIDLDSVNPGDMTRLHRENPDEFDRLTRDMVINTGHVDRRTGQGMQFTIQRGGSPLAQDIIAGVKRAAKRRAGEDS
jgi:hypothetical protein